MPLFFQCYPNTTVKIDDNSLNVLKNSVFPVEDEFEGEDICLNLKALENKMFDNPVTELWWNPNIIIRKNWRKISKWVAKSLIDWTVKQNDNIVCVMTTGCFDTFPSWYDFYYWSSERNKKDIFNQH